MFQSLSFQGTLALPMTTGLSQWVTGLCALLAAGAGDAIGPPEPQVIATLPLVTPSSDSVQVSRKCPKSSEDLYPCTLELTFEKAGKAVGHATSGELPADVVVSAPVGSGSTADAHDYWGALVLGRKVPFYEVAPGESYAVRLAVSAVALDAQTGGLLVIRAYSGDHPVCTVHELWTMTAAKVVRVWSTEDSCSGAPTSRSLAFADADSKTTFRASLLYHTSFDRSFYDEGEAYAGSLSMEVVQWNAKQKVVQPRPVTDATIPVLAVIGASTKDFAAARTTFDALVAKQCADPGLGVYAVPESSRLRAGFYFVGFVDTDRRAAAAHRHKLVRCNPSRRSTIKQVF